MKKIGMVGIGMMGHGIASNVLKHGYELAVLEHPGNQPLDALRQGGAQGFTSAKELAARSDVVILVVTGSPQVEAVLTGAGGVLEGLRPGTIVIDCSTAIPSSTHRMAAAVVAKGGRFLDAPMTRTPKEAAEGRLNLLVGGDADLLEACRPLLKCFAENITHMGPVGAGQLTKMINQICIAGIVQGLAEGIHFGKQAGLDIEKVVDVISKGAAGSWQMENRHKTMNAGKYDFGFAVDWMRKDLGIVLEEARRNQAKLPLTALVDQFYGDVQAMGGNRWDTSSLLARLDRK